MAVGEFSEGGHGWGPHAGERRARPRPARSGPPPLGRVGHSKRLALWGLWLEETLLADVPHRPALLQALGVARQDFTSIHDIDFGVIEPVDDGWLITIKSAAGEDEESFTVSAN